MSLNGFDEAKAICEQAPARGWILRPVHFRLLDIAIVQNDAAGISRQVEVAWGKPEEAFILTTLMFHTEQPDQWHKAEELLRRAIELARQYKVVGPQVSTSAICERRELTRALPLPDPDLAPTI